MEEEDLGSWVVFCFFEVLLVFLLRRRGEFSLGPLPFFFLPDPTCTAKQVKNKNTYYKRFIIQVSFFLPFPPEPVEPLDELLSSFLLSLSKISSASSPTIRSNPEE